MFLPAKASPQSLLVLHTAAEIVASVVPIVVPARLNVPPEELHVSYLLQLGRGSGLF